MLGHVAGQEAEERHQRRVVAVAGGRAREHDLTVRTDGVADLVALAQAQRAAHGFRHRRLIAIGQRRFGFNGDGHGRFSGCELRSKSNAIALLCQCKCIAMRSVVITCQARLDDCLRGIRRAISQRKISSTSKRITFQPPRV